jgi:hypothetical protein
MIFFESERLLNASIDSHLFKNEIKNMKASIKIQDQARGRNWDILSPNTQVDKETSFSRNMDM